LTVAIAESTIDIRSYANISLPDAVIAASALSLNATLITRNVKGFHDVPGLVVYNPFSQ
jgi:predicted nucleic acid-binding protein